MNRHRLNSAALQAGVLLLIAGHATAGEQVIDVQHDSLRGITCWIVNNTGISCLPDSSLMQTPANSVRSEEQTGQASLAASMCRVEQLPATPPPQEKGFQL